MARLVSLLLFFSCYQVSANVTFKKARAQLGNLIINVEVADTPEAQQQGLMGRKNLDINSGMLFIFNESKILSFWMKNTLIDLDIGYFDKEMRLIDVQTMVPQIGLPDSLLKSYPSAKPAQYALEMNKNWFLKNKVKLGAVLRVLKN